MNLPDTADSMIDFLVVTELQPASVEREMR